MPVKKRVAKGKLVHSPTIEALLSGDEIENTEEVYREVLDAFYFGWCENVPPEAIERAGVVLRGWWEAE